MPSCPPPPTKYALVPTSILLLILATGIPVDNNDRAYGSDRPADRTSFTFATCLGPPLRVSAYSSVRQEKIEH